MLNPLLLFPWEFDEEKLAAALEVGRLASEETGVDGEELGKLIWESYKKLTGAIDDTE